MEYIALAAGRGKRLNPLTNTMQKCMYPILGKPFLEYTLEELVGSDFFDRDRDRITIVVGHLREQVQGHFGSNFCGAEIAYVCQEQQWGTAHAVYSAHCALRYEQPVVVWLGDVYFTGDLLGRVAACETDALAYIPLEKAQDLAASPVQVQNGWATYIGWGFSEHTKRGNAADIGCWRLCQETLDLLGEANPRGEWRVLRGLAQRMEEGHEVAAVEADEWIHLGNTPDVETRLRAVLCRMTGLTDEK